MEEANKLKRILINCIRFAFAKKHIPAEITDHIDLEQEVSVGEAAVKAYQSAKTRQEKGEVLSELYHEILHELLKNHPILKKYFKTERFNIWSEIEDQRRYLDTLWDTYRAAENGEDWAIQLIHDEGYRSLEDFRKAIEEKERELEKMIREVEEREAKRLERRKRKVEKAEKKAEAPKELEREVANLRHMLQTVVADKLRLFAKATLLEKGYSVSEVRKAIQRVELEIANLASDVVSGKISEQEAEKEIDELLKEAIIPATMSKEELMKELEHAYTTYLVKHDVTNPKQVLNAVRPDIEALAEEVLEGRMTKEDALERVQRIGIPSVAKFRKEVTPAPVTPEEEEMPVQPVQSRQVFLTPKQAAEMIWSKYLPQLLIFGLKYVFEMYGREEGMTDYILRKTANYLAVYFREIGLKLVEKGEREGKGRLTIVGTALEKYPFLVVWNGVLKAMARTVTDFWSALQPHTDLINALTSIGINGCVAKAFTGVAYEVFHVPMNMWPRDVQQCYETLVNIAGADP